MASSWRRTMGNLRSFVGNSMGGLRGGSNLASWVVAGTLAYFLWVKPSQDLKREQEVRPSSHLLTIKIQLPVPLIHSLQICRKRQLLLLWILIATLRSENPFPIHRYLSTFHKSSLVIIYCVSCLFFVLFWIFLQKTGLIYENKNRNKKSEE